MTDKSEAGRRQLAKIADYKSCFGTESGRRVLWDLMKQHSVLDSTFDPANINEMILREGGRNVVLQILHKLNVDVKRLEEFIRKGHIDGNAIKPK